MIEAIHLVEVLMTLLLIVTFGACMAVAAALGLFLVLSPFFSFLDDVMRHNHD